MHFEILTEDASGGAAVDIILTKILGHNGEEHSWRVHPYRGIGRIPKNIHKAGDPSKRILLGQLPRLLRGYGRSLDPAWAAVVVVVDLDRRDCESFKHELLEVLNACDPRPNTLFRIAIEEIEAWFLGDRNAVRAAYPRAKDAVLNRYSQDSICGTWEVLANIVHPGGAARLSRQGWPHIGEAKYCWATNIASKMNVDANLSQSFRVFRDGVRRLAKGP